MQVAKELGKEIPLLGVCLGHQAICAAFGATVTYAKALMHGKQSLIRTGGNCPLFDGCPDVFRLPGIILWQPRRKQCQTALR